MELNHNLIEKKWKDRWKEDQTYKVENDYSKPKYYVLDMFPYPSGAGLHVGHPLGYIASDIVARQKKMCGYNVLHPMGFDAFGLPAEQYAMQTGIHPSQSTKDNIARYREQLLNIGLNYDWNREVNTSDPLYYKWTQWIFLKLYDHYYDLIEQTAKPISDLILKFEKSGNKEINAFNKQDEIFIADEWNKKTSKEKDDILMNYRLAYRKSSYVNWCEALGTVLANDEIKDGVSERGGHPVEKKPMMQWALRITAYAERLLNELDELDWSEALKNMQRNWIGKSTGLKMFFNIDNHNESIEIFTTRPDTIFGVSFMVLAPEHKLINQITSPENSAQVQQYILSSQAKSEKQRQGDLKKMSGVFTGAYAIHPFTGNKLPIWISDYVLIEYGTGAIMAVPGNDQRDRLFAKEYNLPVIQIVDQSEFPNADGEELIGTMVNSDFLNGLDVKSAIEKSILQIEKNNIGKSVTQYKMRDANFSRQRYWGEPFPIYYDKEGVAYPLYENELPLELPMIKNIEPGKAGHSPLSLANDWVQFNDKYQRETDTMPGYAGSSWYFLRYMDPQNKNEFSSKDALKYWQDVDLYIGGTEHAVGHLMYSRFWHKFLFDLKYVPTKEPFKKLVNQGMIQGVIESLYLVKESNPPHFIDETLSDTFHEDNLAKIPIHIDFINDYNTPNSHLNKKGIGEFIKWRSDYQDAIFQNQSESASYKNLSEHFKIHTYSETGKMSKRYHNVVNPDDVIEKYGADCFRMFEMFLGPIEQAKPWDTKGIDGVHKFLKKFYGLFINEENELHVSEDLPSAEELRILHTCIKKVNQDITNLSFNTSVSAFMICVNELRKLNCNKKSVLQPLMQLMAPFAPFITEELWERLGNNSSIHLSNYPIHSEEYLSSNTINYPVSINGKKRFEWIVDKSISASELEHQVVEIEEIQKWLTGQQIKKIIIVQGRMINIVI